MDCNGIKYLIAAIFYSPFSRMEESFREFIDSRIGLQKFQIDSFTGKLNNSEFVNPNPGGRHFPKFIIWQNVEYKNLTFFISNYEDGLSNLINLIADTSSTALIEFSLSGESELYPAYLFRKKDKNGLIRSIQSYKEDNWVFHQNGNLLEYEQSSIYRKKKIKDRLNNDVILRYLNSEGISDVKKLQQIENGLLFSRTSW